jgi:hypothetical protein
MAKIEVDVDDSALTQVLLKDIGCIHEDIVLLEEIETLSEHQKIDLVDLKRYFKGILLALEYYLPIVEYRELLRKYQDYQ